MARIAHRPGGFNLPKKKHNSGRHRTKGEINRIQTGKIDIKVSSKKHKSLVGRNQRKLTGKERRMMHRNQILTEKRLKGLKCAAIVTVVSFDFGFKVDKFIEAIVAHEDIEYKFNPANTVLYAKLKRFQNAQLGFMIPEYGNIDAVYNCLKTSDIMMIIWPGNGELSETQKDFIRHVKAFGAPSVIHFTPSVTNQKEKSQNKQILDKVISNWAFGEEKFHYLDTKDIYNSLRLIKDYKKKPMAIQVKRSFLVADDISVIGDPEEYITAIKCVVRGAPLNPNRLLCLQSVGNFQIAKIVETDSLWDTKDGSFELHPKPGKREWIPDHEKQEDLQESIIPDPMEGEQTWPSKDDYEMAKKPSEIINESTKKITVKVPKGTSDYQAAWFVNDDEENDDDDDDQEMDECMSDEENWEPKEEDEEEDTRTIMDDNATIHMNEQDMEEDNEAYDIYKDARSHANFPDEIETPKDVLAKQRFQKYRGLKSFKNAKWDPKENLPFDYARIFKISDYLHTKKIISKEVEEDFNDDKSAVPLGTSCIVFLKNAPIHIFDRFVEGAPLVMYQLLRHEQKMSVMNIVLKRVQGFDDIVKNKARMIFQVGFRKFAAEPIFSQHTNGDKFKMERFMPEEGAFVATIYAPITYTPCPVVAYVETDDGRHKLAATGSVLNLNPDRIILKRTVLSGHPFKINKRSVVCRYMFFNKDDIEYFKPLELWTPSGARGHIKESLGTHGLFKCTFDKQLSAMDVILLNLYKRVYPKWNLDQCIPPAKWTLSNYPHGIIPFSALKPST